MVSEEAHRDCGICYALGDHQCCEALPEWVVMGACLPDGHFLGEPCLFGAYRDGFFGNHGDVPATRCTGVLRQSNGVKIDDACAEFAILSG